MIIFFNSKKDSTGAVAQFRFNRRDQKVWLNITKQDSWNAEKNVGSFKGDKLSISLDANELGEIINVITNQGEWAFYHKFDKNSSNGQFKYWEKKVDDKKTLRGFGWSVKTSKDGVEKEARVGLTTGNAYNLVEWAKAILNIIHLDNVDEDQQNMEKYLSQKDNAPKAATKPATELVGAAESQGSNDDVW